MELLAGTYTFEPGCFPLSTDSMVLADFVKLPRAARVLDLGSGSGVLGLLLCARFPACTVVGLEQSETEHEAALENIRRNALEQRLYSICADLRTMPPEVCPGSFHCCVSNPPYFSGGEASRANPLARRDDVCKASDLFAAAARALKFGGDFFLVHKPQSLAQLCHEATRSGLEPKRLILVRHRPAQSPGMILLQCRKGGKVGLSLEELTLFHADGTPTGDYRRIYHH